MDALKVLVKVSVLFTKVSASLLMMGMDLANDFKLFSDVSIVLGTRDM